jgi:hypothetical protein
VLGGCASRGDFTAISGKNVNLSNLKVDRTMSKGRTSGEDCTHIIIFIPTSGPPTLDEALDRALEAKQANLLLDAVVKWHSTVGWAEYNEAQQFTAHPMQLLL